MIRKNGMDTVKHSYLTGTNTRGNIKMGKDTEGENTHLFITEQGNVCAENIALKAKSVKHEIQVFLP